MINKKLRLVLRENKFLRYTIYRFARWLMLDVFKTRERNIKRFGYEAVALIDKVAETVGMPCFAYAGTLLGFIRDRGFIAHDSDIDFAMMPVVGKVSAFFYALEESGFYFERYILLDGKLREFSMRYKEVSIDFFARYYKDSSHSEFHVIGDRCEDHWIMIDIPAPKKLIPYEVHGVSTHVPENYEEMLARCYGNWRQVIKKWNDSMAPKMGKDFTSHEQYLSRNRDEWVAYLEKHNP